jgi:hypothetical protein
MKAYFLCAMIGCALMRGVGHAEPPGGNTATSAQPSQPTASVGHNVPGTPMPANSHSATPGQAKPSPKNGRGPVSGAASIGGPASPAKATPAITGAVNPAKNTGAVNGTGMKRKP